MAAILIPRFTGFQAKARGTQALTDAKQIATALDGYNIEKGDWPADTNAVNEVLTTAFGSTTEATAHGSFTTAPSSSKDGGFEWKTVTGFSAGRTTTGPVHMIP